MASTGTPSTGGETAIIGRQFCVPHVVELAITRKALSWSNADFTVTDANGAVVLKVKGKAFSLRDRRVLEDPAGNPLVSMQSKLSSWHERWNVFRGNSSESRDMLFTVKRSSMFQWKTRLHVFFAGNESHEKVCDLKVNGNFCESAFTISSGDSSTILAKMEEKTNIKNQLLGKDTYKITVSPFMDYALVVALVVIFNEVDGVPDVDVTGDLESNF